MTKSARVGVDADRKDARITPRGPNNGGAFPGAKIDDRPLVTGDQTFELADV
ncbi:MAG: hypothetical protein M3069_30135 [Chloroflexota bacterium]|nr:hypothetical protein [Chloroflexota bacterium]